MQILEFVRLLRGETPSDSRPNKALKIPNSQSSWKRYRYKDRWHDIVYNGVKPRWSSSFPKQDTVPPNHGSAKRALNTIVKNLRAGQDLNRYLILDIDLLPSLQGVTCSPFGAVQKGDLDLSIEARIIHDLSYPSGESVNDNTITGTDIVVSYDGAELLANRVLDVATSSPKLQRMMTGDVNGAFRNIPVCADSVGRFAGTIPELGIVVIDLCCPFGWINSPSSYWVAGGAINHLYANSSHKWTAQPSTGTNTFDAKVWCADHIAIEPDVGSRLSEAHLALRSAMVAILGPDACNGKNFSSWFVKGRALRLDWDLEKLILSMPADKVEKAIRRVRELNTRVKTTRTQLQKLLGSLRHVITCIRSAAPFLQRIASLARRSPQFGYVEITDDVKDDLRWFDLILRIGRLNRIPLVRFTRRHDPSVDIYMDSSDRGLCALFPSRKVYLQVEFSDEEFNLIQTFKSTGDNEFGINVRELMSAVFAAIVWGSAWSHMGEDIETHVRFWIDNTSAVAWNNRKSRRNGYAQMLLRILGVSWSMCCLPVAIWHEPETSRQHVFNDLRETVRSEMVSSQHRWIRPHKNNRFGREENRYHFKSKDKIICPVRRARWIGKDAAYFDTQGEDPALTLRSGGISSEEVATVIKKGAVRLGLDPSRYSTHSVRIGGATAVLNSGANRLVIKQMGRWLSNAFEFPHASTLKSGGQYQ
ncbi:Cleavage induced protein [Phytophthora megakarya]|uniref:Cleavage induced protein n=1 Tax=Phytophthora megakarya TaxID=4795 RepID=A0A225W6A9_9STRA|nr:Cleavage induced protein [Phytophthora megakarya]